MKASQSMLRFYNSEVDRYTTARQYTLLREWEMKNSLKQGQDLGAQAALQRDLLKITADKYDRFQAYPKDIFEIPGFKEFIEEGYYKMMKEMKKTPYKVLKQPSHLRDRDDIAVFRQYCQRFELLADHDEEFYQSL